VGGDHKAITVLRSTSGWIACDDGTDAYGFSALPAGSRNAAGESKYTGYNAAFFWSATEEDRESARYVDMYCSNQRAFLGYSHKDFARSVRCLQD
jgi:uncharacterized protein (TIGR02145 family)